MKRGRTYEKIILAFVFIMVLAGSGCSKKDDNTSNTRLKKIIGHYGDNISWYEYSYDANGNMIQEYLRSGVDDNGNATTESCMTEWVYDSEGMLTQINARWFADFAGSNFRQEYYYNSEVNASTDNRVGRGIISSLYNEFGLGEKTKVQSAH